jgi:hypothetical protein
MDRPSAFPSRLHWRTQEGQRAVSLAQVRDPGASGLWTEATLACVQRAFAGLTLAGEAPGDAEGVVSLGVVPDAATQPPEAGAGEVLTAYELEVSVRVGDRALGATRAVLPPGAVPALRLRPEKPILTAGEELRVKLLRGPDFAGELPDEDSALRLLQGGDEVASLNWDEDGRLIHGTVPEGVHGLLTVDWWGARAILYVPRAEALSVAVTPDQPSYRPGGQARLSVRTRAGERGTAAAVSLFGVDEALSQLAPLLAPDDWGRVTVRASTDREAFERFDARALLTGRIRGENAALATLQRIAAIPESAAEAEAVDASGELRFDPVVPLAETFYDLLSDARRRVSAWEEAAPDGELMTNERAVALWEEMLEERADQGLPVEDAWGRLLSLHRLPPDLLELADPRLLVADARRLPEDVENWQTFVLENAP